MGIDEHNNHLVSSQPQITLSQYEYRVSRLPIQRHHRRRRRRRQDASIGRWAEVTSAVGFTSHRESVSEFDDNTEPSLDSNVKLNENNSLHHTNTDPVKDDGYNLVIHAFPEKTTKAYNSLPTADITPEYKTHSPFDHTLVAPIAPMYIDDVDDQALLQDANDCDSDMSTTHPTDDDKKYDDPNFVSPVSTQGSSSTLYSRKRKALHALNTNAARSHSPHKKSSSSRKKTISSSTFGTLSLSNQLVLMPNDSVEAGSFQEVPCSPPDEDAIEDSQMYIHRRPAKSLTRAKATTISAKALRYRMTVAKSGLGSSDSFVRPKSLRRRSPYQRSAFYLGDGFDAKERTIAGHELSTKKSSAKGRGSLSAVAPGLELESSLDLPIVSAQSHVVNEDIELPLLEDVRITNEPEEIEDFEHLEDLVRLQEEPAVRIAKMTGRLRQATLSGASGRKKQVVRSKSSKQGRRKSAQCSLQSLELVHDNDIPWSLPPAIITEPQDQTCPKTRRLSPLQAKLRRRTNCQTSEDGFDTFEDSRASCSRTPCTTATSFQVFSVPGNFNAIGQLAEISDELIEDDGPATLRRRLITFASLRTQGPQDGLVIPRTAQAAYPTPSATITTSHCRQAWDTPSRLFLPAQVSRVGYTELVEDLIKEDEEQFDKTGYGHSRSGAQFSPCRIDTARSTQLGASSTIPDDGELRWDCTARPVNAIVHLPVNLGRSSKSLKELTRTVSRRAGTTAPEKSVMKRRTSHLLTLKAPFRHDEVVSRSAHVG